MVYGLDFGVKWSKGLGFKGLSSGGFRVYGLGGLCGDLRFMGLGLRGFRT